MKIDLIADVHIGNHRIFGGGYQHAVNRRCRLVLDTLARVYDGDADQVVIAGDLFHSDTPTPQILAEVQDIVKKIPTVMMVGNHDVRTMTPGDHALAPLAPVARVIDVTTVVGDLVLVPFQTGDPLEWLPVELARQDVQGKSAILHMGVSDASTPEYLRISGGCINVRDLDRIASAAGLARVFCGDWHKHREWEPTPAEPVEGVATPESRSTYIEQIGALSPTGFDNPGFVGYGNVTRLDTESVIAHREIPGPRFLRYQARADFSRRRWDIAATAGHTVFVSALLPPADVYLATSDLEFSRGCSEIGGFKVLPSVDTALERVKKTTEAAMSASSFEDAIVAYVKACAFEADTGEIARRVLAYYKM